MSEEQAAQLQPELAAPSEKLPAAEMLVEAVAAKESPAREKVLHLSLAGQAASIALRACVDAANNGNVTRKLALFEIMKLPLPDQPK